ncbi:MAG: hypothetical protein GY710_13215 [Desulfobacteraceae bacterium]|nr:hypothetical protein [Desulfobacteraceae bacterium]
MSEKIQNNYSLSSFHCPHCNRFLFRGKIRDLKMACPYCHRLMVIDGRQQGQGAQIVLKK